MRLLAAGSLAAWGLAAALGCGSRPPVRPAQAVTAPRAGVAAAARKDSVAVAASALDEATAPALLDSEGEGNFEGDILNIDVAAADFATLKSPVRPVAVDLAALAHTRLPPMPTY